MSSTRRSTRRIRPTTVNRAVARRLGGTMSRLWSAARPLNPTRSGKSSVAGTSCVPSRNRHLEYVEKADGSRWDPSAGASKNCTTGTQRPQHVAHADPSLSQATPVQTVCCPS